MEWGYEAFPGYEVLTGCARGLTNKFVGNVGAQISILRQLAPAAFEYQSAVPTALILINEDQARSISAEMKKIMEEGKTESDELALVSAAKIKYFPQIRLHDQESTAISLVLDANFSDDVIVEPGYVRYLIESRIPRLPEWYADAMADLYSRATFRTSPQASNENGSVVPGWTEVAFSPLSSMPKTGMPELVPLQDILMDSGKRPEETQRDKAISVKKFESALFLQWVIADHTESRSDALRRYLDLGDKGDRSENAFQQCFGLTFDQALHHLRRYMLDNAGEIINRGSTFLDMEIPFRDATSTEVARIWGNWELLETRFVRDEDPKLVGPYLKQADHTLEGSYAGGERDSGFLAVLGLFRADKEEFPAALSALEAAVSKQTAYPRAYTELARLRFKEALARPEGPSGKLSGRQVEAIVHPLRIARRLFPSQRETYILAALAYGNSLSAPSQDDRAFMGEGLQLFPNDRQLVSVIATLSKTPLLKNELR